MPTAAVLYPALLASLAREVSLLGRPARPEAEMMTGGVLWRPVRPILAAYLPVRRAALLGGSGFNRQTRRHNKSTTFLTNTPPLSTVSHSMYKNQNPLAQTSFKSYAYSHTSYLSLFLHPHILRPENFSLKSA